MSLYLLYLELRECMDNLYEQTHNMELLQDQLSLHTKYLVLPLLLDPSDATTIFLFVLVCSSSVYSRLEHIQLERYHPHLWFASS